MSIIDSWSERVHDDYNEHMCSCRICFMVPVDDEPKGLCPEGVKVWQALQNFIHFEDE